MREWEKISDISTLCLMKKYFVKWTICIFGTNFFIGNPLLSRNWQKFRESIDLMKELISRNIFSVKVFQVVLCTEILSHIFDKNFVKSMVLLKKLLNSWFDDFFFQWERISRFSTVHCAMQILEIYANNFLIKISWKQLISYKEVSTKNANSSFDEIFFH